MTGSSLKLDGQGICSPLTNREEHFWKEVDPVQVTGSILKIDFSRDLTVFSIVLINTRKNTIDF